MARVWAGAGPTFSVFCAAALPASQSDDTLIKVSCKRRGRGHATSEIGRPGCVCRPISPADQPALSSLWYSAGWIVYEGITCWAAFNPASWQRMLLLSYCYQSHMVRNWATTAYILCNMIFFCDCQGIFTRKCWFNAGPSSQLMDQQ